MQQIRGKISGVWLQAQGQHFMDVLPENMVQTNLLILHFYSAVHRFTFVVIVGQKISKPTLAVSLCFRL